MKHTPGPWETEGTFIKGYSTKNDDGGYVAAMLYRPIKDESFANAQLIATAPDLLSTLKLALHALINIRARGETAYLPIIKRAEEAISRAEKGE